MKKAFLSLTLVGLSGMAVAGDWRSQCPNYAESSAVVMSWDTRLLTEDVSPGSNLTSLPIGFLLLFR